LDTIDWGGAQIAVVHAEVGGWEVISNELKNGNSLSKEVVIQKNVLNVRWSHVSEVNKFAIDSDDVVLR
jgi:hypothetical protein